MAKRKVTYTFYTDDNDAGGIDKLTTARKIKVAAISAGESMAAWARELEVSRQFVFQVVKGVRNNQRVRDFIEERLGMTFWVKEEHCEQTAEVN